MNPVPTSFNHLQDEAAYERVASDEEQEEQRERSPPLSEGDDSDKVTVMVKGVETTDIILDLFSNDEGCHTHAHHAPCYERSPQSSSFDS